MVTMFKKKEKPIFSEKVLTLYNRLSLVCGIFSLILAPTGLFGIIPGFLGICLGVTYNTETKKIKFGFFLSIVGSIISALFLTYILLMAYGVNAF